MARKIKDDSEPFYELGEVLGVVKESDTTDWGKVVAYFTWLKKTKGGDKTTLDVRNYNFGTRQIGKGISLSSEEADRLTDILLEHDFGSVEELEKALRRKKDFFTISDEIDSSLSDDGMYNIII